MGGIYNQELIEYQDVQHGITSTIYSRYGVHIDSIYDRDKVPEPVNLINRAGPSVGRRPEPAGVTV